MNQKRVFSHTAFLAIIACLLWSSAFVGVKIGLKYHTPFQFAGVRFILSGIMLMLYLNNFRDYWREVRREWRFVIKVAVFQTVIQYMLFYSGINLLPAAVSAMIIGSSPLFISTVSHFMLHNDKMTGMKSMSLVLGVIGVAIISFGRSGLDTAVQISLLGVGLLLVNNVVSGYSNVLVAQRPGAVSPVVLSSSTLFLGGIVLVLISIPVEGFSLHSPATEYFISLGWLSFLSAAAFAIWYTLLKRPGVKVSELNTWKFIIPVAGAMLSWLVMPDERPDLKSVSGMIVIASSLLVMNFSNLRAGLKSTLFSK